MTDTAISLRLPKEMKRELDALAKATKRSRSYLVNEAIADYVEHERKIVQGIEKARRELNAGKGVPHDEAMALLDRAIDSVKSKRRG
jgi:predicted transcriptional regulator